MDALGGPEGLLELSERLPELAHGGADEELRDGYADLQTNIANALGNATHVNRDNASEAQWYEDFMSGLHEAGMEQDSDTSVTEDVAGVRGYQHLVTLLQAGNGYSTRFLTDLADNIRSAEDPSKGGNSDIWQETLTSRGLDDPEHEAPGWFAQDPLDGVLGIMGRHPDAAASYLDPNNGDNLEYLINNRNWDLDQLMESSPDSDDIDITTEENEGARTGLADALEAATTGRPAGSGENVPYERTAAGDRVMHDTIEMFTANGAELIADDGDFAFMRPQLGRMGAAYMAEIQYELGRDIDPLDQFNEEPSVLHGLDLETFISQTGRNPEGYAALAGAQQAHTALSVNEAMNGNSHSDVDLYDRVNNAVVPGYVVAGILANARASAIYEAGLASDEEFNSRIDMAQEVSGLVFEEAAGRVPVFGGGIAYLTEQVTGGIADQFRRDNEEEYYQDADGLYQQAQEDALESAQQAIRAAGGEGRHNDDTIDDLEDGVTNELIDSFDSGYNWRTNRAN